MSVDHLLVDNRVADLTQPSKTISPRVLFCALGCALVGAPLVVYPTFVINAICFALFAVSFNLLLGYGGLMSFGHAVYFGMGSYVAGYAAKIWGLPTELALVAGTLMGGCLGLVSGLIAIRRQGIYFAMITMALGQVVYFYCTQAQWTGGEDGIQQIPRGTLFGILDLGSDLVMCWVLTVLFMLSLFLVARAVGSPFGQVLACIRQNEQRAISLGYRVGRYKLLVFTLSATLAGLAGAMKAIATEIASLTDVHGAMSGEVVLMTLVGGLGTMSGPLVGSVLVLAMQHYLATLGDWVMFIQGFVFVACVLMFREGLVGVADKLAAGLRSSSRSTVATFFGRRWPARAIPKADLPSSADPIAKLRGGAGVLNSQTLQ